MIDKTEVEKENQELTPYQGAYKKDLLKPDEELEPDVSDLSEIEKTQIPEGLVTKSKDHDWKKRYADLKSYHDRQKNEWVQQKELMEAKAQLTEKSKILSEMPKSQEEIDEFKKDYPDVYGIVETVSKLQAEAKAVELEERITALRQREEEASYKTAEQELISEHPDFLELKQDAEFLDWLEKQPSTIADGIYKNRTDAKWAARVIDLYKLDSNQVNQKQPKSRQGAAAVVTKTKKTSPKTGDEDKKIWSVAEIARLKPHEFEKLEKEIDVAHREGRIK